MLNDLLKASEKLAFSNNKIGYPRSNKGKTKNPGIKHKAKAITVMIVEIKL